MGDALEEVAANGRARWTTLIRNWTFCPCFKKKVPLLQFWWIALVSSHNFCQNKHVQHVLGLCLSRIPFQGMMCEYVRGPTTIKAEIGPFYVSNIGVVTWRKHQHAYIVLGSQYLHSVIGNPSFRRSCGLITHFIEWSKIILRIIHGWHSIQEISSQRWQP